MSCGTYKRMVRRKKRGGIINLQVCKPQKWQREATVRTGTGHEQDGNSPSSLQDFMGRKKVEEINTDASIRICYYEVER